MNVQPPRRQEKLFAKLRKTLENWRDRAPLRVYRLAEGEEDAALMLRHLATQSLSSPRRFRF